MQLKKWTNIPIEGITNLQDLGVILNKKLNLMFNKTSEENKYNTFSNNASSGAFTLTATPQAVCTVNVSNYTTSATYNIFFSAIIGSFGAVTVGIYVDDVLQNEFDYNAATISLNTSITTARGLKTITIKLDGTGTIADGKANLAVFL